MIGKARSVDTLGQSPSDFALGKVGTEGAVGIWEPTADIALETGSARHELWQHDRSCHESAHQLIVDKDIEGFQLVCGSY
jgi:hypothetical protein